MAIDKGFGTVWLAQALLQLLEEILMSLVMVP